MTQSPGHPQQPGAPAFPQQPAQPQYQPPYQQPAPAPQYQQPAPQQQPQYQQPAPQQQPQYQQPAQGRPLPSLAGARVGNNNGKKLPIGTFAVEVDECRVFYSAHYSTTYFIVEFVIQESSNPQVRAGERYSWARPFEDQYGYGPGDIKGWICLVIETKMPGSDPVSQWDEGYTAWVAAQDGELNHPQPAKGMRMSVEVWEKPKKNSTGHTLVHDWRVLADGETLGLSTPANPTAPPMPMGTPQMPPMPPATPQQQPYQAPSAPQQSYQTPPAPQVTGGPPPGWPAGQPWPPGSPPQPAPVDDIPF